MIKLKDLLKEKIISVVNKQYHTINEELTAYHASPNKFYKFDISKLGSGTGNQFSGWGIYLSGKKETIKSYGKYLYQTTLFKGKSSKQDTLLDISSAVKKDIVIKVLKEIYKLKNKKFDITKFNSYYNYTKNKSLPKVDFNDYELIEFDYNGYLFYKTLSRLLGGDKNASLFLLKSGIYGLKRNVSGTVTDYILFDENVINIEKITDSETDTDIYTTEINNMIKLKDILNEENWKADKSVITFNGEEVGDYSFDRDSDAFWIDDLHSRGQKGFDTKADMIAYIKKNKVAYLKARKAYVSRGYMREDTSNEDLRKWFGKGKTGSTTGGGWDRYNSKGEKVGKCGDSKEGSAYAACLSKEKAAKLGPDGRASFVNRKRSAQSKAGDSKKGGEQSKGQKPTLVKTGASEGVKEDWSQKYKGSIDCNNPKGFSQKAHCAGKSKNENMTSKLTVEEKLNLFLERNCPNDPRKWSASKAAAKSKFDVYPSAYANAFAAKNYKGKGGTWKKCNEGEMNALCEDCWDGYKQVGGKMKNGKQVPNCVPINEEEISPENEREMIEGIAEIVRGIKDIDNRKESAKKQIKQLKAEGIKLDVKEFLSLCGFKNKQEEIDEYDVETIQEIQDFKQFIREYATLLTEGNCNCITEAEYRGRKVQLGKPMQGDVKKFKVYVKNPAGKVVKVNFGQKGMVIKKNNPERRKSFRARMNCDNPGPRTKANYWSCRKW